MRGHTLLTLSAALVLTGAPALAQSSSGAEFSRPYGMTPGQETRPYQGARGAGGNRVVINGIIQTGVGVSAQASAIGSITGSVTGGVGQGGAYAQSNATAIGNQLNVVVNGRYNTVVVNSSQINNGNVTAEAGAIANAQGESDSDANSDSGGSQ